MENEYWEYVLECLDFNIKPVDEREWRYGYNDRIN